MAVNANETIQGWMKLEVNDHRSYDITAVISDRLEAVGRFNDAGTRTRTGSWKLHEQTYHYDNTNVDISRPEFNSMYSPPGLEQIVSPSDVMQL